MKKALFILGMLLSAIPGHAQLPQYTAGTSVSGNYFPFGSSGGIGSKVQLLYKPSDFSILPRSGTITKIYFKAANAAEASGLNHYTNLSIRMGTTDLDVLNRGKSNFAAPLAPVFQSEEYDIDFRPGMWLKPILLQTPFSYSNSSNLIVEISAKNTSTMKYVGFTQTAETRRMWGVAGSDNTINGDCGLYAIGFDIEPANVIPATVALTSPVIMETKDISPQVAAKKDSPILNTVSEKNAVATVDVLPPAEKQEPIVPVKTTSNAWFLLLSTLLAILGMGALYPVLPKAKHVSHWAMKNPKKTRAMIFASHLVTSIAGFYLGKVMYDQGIVTSAASTNILFAGAATGALLYPRRNKPTGSLWNHFRKQKMLAMFMALTGFALITNLGNRAAADKNYSPAASKVITVMDRSHYDEGPVYSFAGAYSGGGKKYETKELVSNILLSILATAVLVALMAVVVIGACLLICADQIIFAALLLSIGGGGGIYLFIRVLKAIWRPKNR